MSSYKDNLTIKLNFFPEICVIDLFCINLQNATHISESESRSLRLYWGNKGVIIVPVQFKIKTAKLSGSISILAGPNQNLLYICSPTTMIGIP